MTTVLMLGDSLIEWGDWNTLLPRYMVINRGIAGETTEGLAGRLLDELNDQDEPDVLLLQSGTNNLLMGNPHFTAIYSSLVPTIRSFYPRAPILISSLMPMPVVAEHVLKKVNQELRDVAEATDNCYFMDVVPPFLEQCLPITHPGFLADQVHLSTRGYQVWAAEIERHLNTILRVQ
ncbi:GDSL-type esterase/lipase family protein [Desulfogranum japonicum]|uniref:GDSL-type esterase/lipase family protein n=1 Tax=Desulfogranum japonicum TaxID=231447 RepID=UPI0004139102|nr:GDSL-type esterase/lipase family protein [Desulfogranum japonicum]